MSVSASEQASLVCLLYLKIPLDENAQRYVDRTEELVVPASTPTTFIRTFFISALQNPVVWLSLLQSDSRDSVSYLRLWPDTQGLKPSFTC